MLSLNLYTLKDTIKVYDEEITVLDEQKANINSIIDELPDGYKGEQAETFIRSMEDLFRFDYDKLQEQLKKVREILYDYIQPAATKLMKRCNGFHEIVSGDNLYPGYESDRGQLGIVQFEEDNCQSVFNKTIELMSEYIPNKESDTVALYECTLGGGVFGLGSGFKYTSFSISEEYSELLNIYSKQQNRLTAFNQSVITYYTEAQNLEETAVMKFSAHIAPELQNIDRDIYKPLVGADGSINMERLEYIMNQSPENISKQEYAAMLEYLLTLSPDKEEDLELLEKFIAASYCVSTEHRLEDLYGVQNETYKISPVMEALIGMYNQTVTQLLEENGGIYFSEETPEILKARENLSKIMTTGFILNAFATNLPVITLDQMEFKGEKDFFDIQSNDNENMPGFAIEFKDGVGLIDSNLASHEAKDISVYQFSTSNNSVFRDQLIAYFESFKRDFRKEAIGYVGEEFVSNVVDKAVEVATTGIPGANIATIVVTGVFDLADLYSDIQENNQQVENGKVAVVMQQVYNAFYMASNITIDQNNAAHGDYYLFNVDRLQQALVVYNEDKNNDYTASELIEYLKNYENISDDKKEIVQDYVEWFGQNENRAESQ